MQYDTQQMQKLGRHVYTEALIRVGWVRRECPDGVVRYYSPRQQFPTPAEWPGIMEQAALGGSIPGYMGTLAECCWEGITDAIKHEDFMLDADMVPTALNGTPFDKLSIAAREVHGRCMQAAGWYLIMREGKQGCTWESPRGDQYYTKGGAAAPVAAIQDAVISNDYRIDKETFLPLFENKAFKADGKCKRCGGIDKDHASHCPRSEFVHDNELDL